MFLTKRFIQNRVQSNSIYLNYANFFIKKWLLCAHTGVNCASFCIFFWYFLHFTPFLLHHSTKELTVALLVITAAVEAMSADMIFG